MSSRKSEPLTQKDVKPIIAEYRITDDDYLNLDDEQLKLKETINSLPDSDFIMWCLYCELASERKLAAMLGISRSPISKELRRIRETIKKRLEYDC